MVRGKICYSMCFYKCKHLPYFQIFVLLQPLRKFCRLTFPCFWVVHPWKKKNILSSQDSNSLSLLTEISGVEALVPARSVSVLQSLASGLPGCWGEVGSRWEWCWRSWKEPSVDPSEGRREGSCWSLEGWGRDINTVMRDTVLSPCLSMVSVPL